MIKYKVMKKRQISPYQQTEYRRRRWYHEPRIGQPGDSNCEIGYYATDIEGLLYRGLWRDDECAYECKVKGRQAGTAPLKTCYEYLQVIRPLDKTDVIDLARQAHERLGFSLAEALYPINPLHITRGVPTADELGLLRQWDSVRASVWVRALVRASVGASVRASVRASVGDSVGASVWASVRSYTGSLFPGIKNWRYINHPAGVYPFEPANKLWRAGLVPSYDGQTWRLHAGADADIVWEDLGKELFE